MVDSLPFQSLCSRDAYVERNGLLSPRIKRCGAAVCQSLGESDKVDTRREMGQRR